MKYCLILGSNSDIGQALAYQYGSNGYHLILASRSISDYQIRLKSDLEIKHNIQVVLAAFEGSQYLEHDKFWKELPVIPDVVIAVFGYLGDQNSALNNFQETYNIISSNFIGQVSLINRYVQLVKGQKDGIIIGISSVAGERGRKSNYIYGASKAAFTTYLSGLRNDLFSQNIHVMTVIPGFVQTKMLGDLKTPKPLTASPQQVANAIFNAQKKKKDVIYVLPLWKLIMLIIKCIPEFIFKKMNL